LEVPYDPYADFRPRGRLGRAVRIIMLAIVAAVGGVIVGGVGVFALVNVLMPSPLPHRVREATAPIAATSQRASVAAPNGEPRATLAAPQGPPSMEAQTAPAAQPSNARPDALSRAPRHAANPRAGRRLYGYAPQPYGQPAKRWGETAARNPQPWPPNAAADRYRADANVRGGFFGQPVDHGWSLDQMRQAPARGFDRRWPSGRDRDQANYRSANPQWRPGYGARSYGQFGNFGNDQWVGDWRH
jgi:hypothetical protein